MLVIFVLLPRKILCRCASRSFGTKVSRQGHAYKLLTRPQAIDKAPLEDVSMKHRRWKIPSQRPSQQVEVTRGVGSPPITYTILAVARKGRLNCFMKLHAHMRSTRIRCYLLLKLCVPWFDNIAFRKVEGDVAKHRPPISLGARGNTKSDGWMNLTRHA